jgi:hypothetical protein
MNPRTRKAALYAIAAIAILASANALAHSYAGLYDWAVHHRLGGWQATSWPAEIDVFLAVGELALYIAYLDGWPARQRIWPWATALIGLAVSVAGNVGHVQAEPGQPVILADRLTAATSPLAAFAGLSVGLLVLKMTRQRANSRARELGTSTTLVLAPHSPGGGQAGRRRPPRRESSGPPCPMTGQKMVTTTAPSRVPACCATPQLSASMRPQAASGSASGPWPGSCACAGTGSPTITSSRSRRALDSPRAGRRDPADKRAYGRASGAQPGLARERQMACMTSKRAWPGCGMQAPFPSCWRRASTRSRPSASSLAAARTWCLHCSPPS